MTAQAKNLVVLEDYRKQKVSPANSSTGAISLAKIQELLEEFKVGQKLILDSLGLTTTMAKVPETIAQPKIYRLSGPVQFFSKLTELWRLEVEDACKLLGYELSEIKYVEDVLSGVSPLLGRDPKDRIANLLVMRKRLDGLFKDIDDENEWLREKRTDLDNKSPIELLLSGSMENLLLVRQFVEFVSGL